jgi:eukaryotic-like serine/threonine-protein kinase
MSESLEQVQRAFTAYAIERELGTGGMATVYLAHDRKHDRKVAIKIVHAQLAALLGAKRFIQEIRVTANLQHPHILGLIDSGTIGAESPELEGRPYYVMPFIDGESLRQRLDREQQLPISDCVRIAAEVASALDYAHRHGVVHRDIKPENILLHDGSAIVADFGIALAVTQAAGARMTQSGVSLGTPMYMSPEQAAGERTITGLSDIYALGVVTYEMIAGEPPFTGPTARAVAARVVAEEPRSVAAQRPTVPPNVAAAVSRALQKIPADRFATAHEFAQALNDPSSTHGGPLARTAPDRSKRRLQRMLYGVTALAILTSVTTVWAWTRPVPSKRVVRYSLAMDSTEAIVKSASFAGRLAISPDGSRLAYVGGPHAQLVIRRSDQLHAVAIPGTEGASTPFFSPDGERVGFVAGGKTLKLVTLNGGSPIAVTDSIVGSGGASWGPDGYIYVDAQAVGGLLRVADKAGAAPKWFTVLDTAMGEIDHTQPHALPNGKGVVFTIQSNGKTAVNGATSFAIGVADIPSGRHRVIVSDATDAWYASGRLLYVTSNGTLMTAPFDQNTMKVSGKATALANDIRQGYGGSADLAVSQDGTLIYLTGATAGDELVWVTRDGKTQPVDPDWRADEFSAPAISPDGKSVAVTRTLTRHATSDIWIKRLDRGSSIRLTLDGRDNYGGTWAPDGGSVTFSSTGAKGDLLSKRADGTGQQVVRLRERWDLYNPRWSPDGKWLVYQTDVAAAGIADIHGIRPGIDTVPVPLVTSRFSDMAPVISPDGRWMAYASDETGRFEIYVVPFPDTRIEKWEVSTSGGTEPLWPHRGNELFYRESSGNLVAVEVKSTPTFSMGRSVPLFSATSFASEKWGLDYALSSDDRHFLMVRPLDSNAPDQLIVIENWLEELKARPQE